MKSLFYAVCLLSFSSLTNAGGWLNPGVPTRIDLVGTNGIMVFGAFGGAGCSRADQFFISSTVPWYKDAYSMILAAYMSGKKIRAYSHTCKPVGWYSTTDITYPFVESYSSVYIQN